jgi:hypothetical protein
LVRSSESLKGLYNPSFKASITNIFSSLFKIASAFPTNGSHEKCDEEMFITYHIDHYIYVETINGELEVEYIFNSKKFVLFLIFIRRP